MYQLEQNRFFRIFHGQPIKLRWGGWISDTYLLHREGWAFFAEESVNNYGNSYLVRLAATSPDNAMTISGILHIPIQELFGGFGYSDNFYVEDVLSRGFPMQQYSSKDVFRTVSMDEINSWNKMQQIDIFAPREVSSRQYMMRDFKIFQPIDRTRTDKEIYIPEESVDELLNRILQIQYPEQQEIKKGLIMPERKPIIQAKIFSLVA